MRNPKNMLIVGIVLLVVGVGIRIKAPPIWKLPEMRKMRRKLLPLFQAITKGSL